jgi:hypothetical protein
VVPRASSSHNDPKGRYGAFFILLKLVIYDLNGVEKKVAHQAPLTRRESGNGFYISIIIRKKEER